jgi:cysteinyl-tRNA synthetase
MKRVKLKLNGAPGWHIECSAMALKYLGPHFDIHTGGIDHVPVHHTNEIAQAQAAHIPFANYWLHGEHLVLKDNEKMAKSGENFLTVATLIEHNYDPLDYRYMCLTTHYRKQLMFSWDALDTAKQAFASLKNKIFLYKDAQDTGDIDCHAAYGVKFLEAVTDDLNMPQALAVLWDVLSDDKLGGKDKYALALQFDTVLGLNLHQVGQEIIPEAIMQLVQEREAARARKEWKKSDELRDMVSNRGYEIRDTKEGAVVRPK